MLRTGKQSRFDAAWRATDRLVGTPRVPALPAGDMAELPGRGSTYLVDTGGEKPPLILLHALACTGLLTWYPSLEMLRTRYRLVIFDQRWHGRGIRSPRFDLADLADDVAAVADLLGIDRFAVAGYSLGSLVAQTVARRHPDRVAGLVLCASATHFARSESAQRRLARIAAGAPLGAVLPATTRAFDESAQGRWAWQQFRSTSAREVAGAARVIAGFDSRSWIGEVSAPAAVVVTIQDRLIPAQRQRELAARIRGSLVYEADAGHASCVLGAARFTPALAAACASVSARIAASPR